MGSVDISKMKNRLQEEERRETARDRPSFRYWTPAVGKNVIRLLPPWTDEGPSSGDFYREFFVHWSDDANNVQSFTCPEKTPNVENGGNCSICAYVAALRATKNLADSELAGKLAARQRFNSNIVDLQDPVYTKKEVDEWNDRNSESGRECSFEIGDTKVQLFSYGPMIFKDLLSIFSQGIDITHPQKGYNLHIRRDGKGRLTKYRVALDVGAGQCALEVEGKGLPEIMVNLDSVLQFKKSEDVTAYVNTLPPLGMLNSAPHNPVSSVKKTGPLADPPPPCFKDATVWSDSDPECVGGVKEGQEYDPCPVFTECGEAVGKLGGKRQSSRRAAKPTVEAGEMDELEAAMRKALAESNKNG